MLRTIVIFRQLHIRNFHQKSKPSTLSKWLPADIQNQTKIFLLPRRAYPGLWDGPVSKRSLPGQGLKKVKVSDLAEKDKNSAVLMWMDRQQKNQEKARKQGRKVPDAKLYWRFLFKYLLLGVVLTLTYQDLLDLFEAAFDEPEFIASVSLASSNSDSPLNNLYKKLPLRVVSRIWGRITDAELPTFILTPLLQQYSRVFGVNMDEALVEDLSVYKSVGQFFRRPLKPELRPISEESEIVSPADGKVLISGKICGGAIDEVKDLSYSLPKFLGPLVSKPETLVKSLDGKQTLLRKPDDYQKLLLENPNNQLLYCVVYLSPGDCHRFFSPVDWKMKHRRHFPGELLSVSPAVVKKVPELFAINERVILSGKWKHGFFAMCPIGATNVGSIKIYEDLTLMTNRVKWQKGSYYDLCYGEEGHSIGKGEEIGEFNMGSSIVLIFEAPKDMKLNLKFGQVVQYGEAMLETNHNFKECSKES